MVRLLLERGAKIDARTKVRQAQSLIFTSTVLKVESNQAHLGAPAQCSVVFILGW